MHLAQKYALECGAKIEKPFLNEQFYPLPFEDYIVIHAGGAMPSKLYSYYNEVVTLLREYTSLDIIQIGGKEDPQIKGVFSLLGQTNFQQTAFIIKNAQLFIGNDSCNAHIASSYDVPMVELFGPTTPENHGAFFSSPEKLISLVGNLNGGKASFNPEENPKVINTIKVEDVVNSCLKLLNHAEQVTFKTHYIGPKYQQAGIDLVPNCVMPPNMAEGVIPQIRMDYFFDEQCLAQNLNIRPAVIVTDRVINLDLIKHFKKHIESLVYEIKSDYDVDFVRGIANLGINYILYSKLSGKELLDAKLNLIDFHVILPKKTEYKDAPDLSKFNNKTLFSTNRFLAANSKIYLSKTHWERDIPTESFEENTALLILDDANFGPSSEYFFIFNL